MPVRSRVLSLVSLLALLAVGIGCAPAGPQGSEVTGGPRASAAARPAPLVASAHNDTSTPFNLVSVPALTRHRYDGRAFRIERRLSEGAGHTRYLISYRGGGLRITGVLTVPRGAGRHPVVVLAHGYHPPARYTTAASMRREQVFFAERGYVVLHPDYRNYGGSDGEARRVVKQPRGYPEDLINAVRALRRADLPFADTRRVGFFGRSMGGGVALNAVTARPGLADAVVLSAPLSSRARQNLDRWVRGEPGRRPLFRRVVRAYGTPEQNPRFWRRASAYHYLDRVDLPVQIHHGTADTTCPLRWSRATAAALRADGGRVGLLTYRGVGHRFGPAQGLLLRRAAAFFDSHV